MKSGKRCVVLCVFLFVGFVLEINGRVKAEEESSTEGSTIAESTAAVETTTPAGSSVTEGAGSTAGSSVTEGAGSTEGAEGGSEITSKTGPTAALAEGGTSASVEGGSTKEDTNFTEETTDAKPKRKSTIDTPIGRGNMWSMTQPSPEDLGETSTTSESTDITWNENEKLRRIQQEVAGFALEMPKDLQARVALIKWIQSDDKYGPKYQHYRGFYYTVGAFVTERAIVCTPSKEVKIKIKSVDNWYVHHLYIDLGRSIPVNITAKDFSLYFHPNFTMSLDNPNRIALILLNDDGLKIAQNSHVQPTPMVGNPLMYEPEILPLENYAVVRCNLIVFGVYEPSMQRRVVAIPFTATPCTYLKEAASKFSSKICGYTRLTRKTVDLMSHRYEYPNDYGSPLFCHNHLVGMYSGIQNIAGNRSKNLEYASRVDFVPSFYSRKLGVDEQHTLEVPGHEKNMNFIFSITDEDPNAKWLPKMPVAEDPCVGTSTLTIKPWVLKNNVKTTSSVTRNQGSPSNGITQGPPSPSDPRGLGTTDDGGEDHSSQGTTGGQGPIGQTTADVQGTPDQNTSDDQSLPV